MRKVFDVGGGDAIVFPTDPPEEDETSSIKPIVDTPIKPKACPDDSNFCEADDYPS